MKKLIRFCYRCCIAFSALCKCSHVRLVAGLDDGEGRGVVVAPDVAACAKEAHDGTWKERMGKWVDYI